MLILRLAPCLLGALLLAPPAPSGAAEGLIPPTVGELTLESCPGAVPDGWCGHIERPLDPGDAAAGSIAIGFEWYPATGGEAVGTIVAIQGGPGFATTGGRAIFRAVLAGATARRNLLLFDVRGTGTSEPIVCPGAQSARKLFDPSAAAACAGVLGPDAGFYGTVAATDDLLALLDALGLGHVDLYGVSYGTVFEQVFALRHPDRLRTLVLDSALPVDADFFERGEAGWRTFAQALYAVCKRDPDCQPSRVQDDLHALFAAIGDGRVEEIGARSLSDTFMSAGYDGIAYREVGGAVAAWRHGDAAPLERLIGTTERNLGLSGIPPEFGSAGTFLAVSCTDMPLPFDVAADPATRRLQAEARMQALLDRSAALPPMTEDELADVRDLATFCADWPAPPATVEPATALPAEGPYPGVPALVLSGELDTVAPPALGAVVAERFPRGLQIVVRNALHGTATPTGWMAPDATDAGSGCVDRIIARFIDTMSPGDLDCLADRPPLPVAAPPPRRLAEVAPAEAVSGHPPESDLRLGAAVAGAVGDVLMRFGRARDDGLRGGTTSLFTAERGFAIKLDGVRWVEDVALTGSIRLDSTSGVVTGSFAVEAPDGVTGTLSVGWLARDRKPVAMITGTLEGGPLGRRELYARLPAP